MALAQRGLTMSDDELVARVRGGDELAFERLYGRYSRRVGSYVAGMVGDAGRAEDVTQEVFVSALRRLRATDQPVLFKPWVYEIARNASIDEFRRSRRLRETPTQHADDEAHQGLEALPIGAPGPERAVETRETLGDLTSAIGGLTETHRRVLVLRELEGRSYDEIARLTGLTRPAVESALFRARRRLSSEYAELASGRRCAAVRQSVQADGALHGRRRETARRHLSHCQGCRRHAAAVGFDLGALGLGRGTTGGGRIAALLPLPAVLWVRRVAETAHCSVEYVAGWGKASAATAVVLAAGSAGVATHHDAARDLQRPVAEQRATSRDARDVRPASTRTGAAAPIRAAAAGSARAAARGAAGREAAVSRREGGAPVAAPSAPASRERSVPSVGPAQPQPQPTPAAPAPATDGASAGGDATPQAGPASSVPAAGVVGRPTPPAPTTPGFDAPSASLPTALEAAAVPAAARTQQAVTQTAAAAASTAQAAGESAQARQASASAPPAGAGTVPAAGG